MKEFTELQGMIGGLYARPQGLGEARCAGDLWQYTPASADDAIPPTVEGQLLGLADRIGRRSWKCSARHWSRRDRRIRLRCGARRMDVISILAESGLPLKLSELERLATSPEQDALAETATSAVAAFFRERLDFYLREVMGYSYDVAKAVLAAGADDVARCHRAREGVDGGARLRCGGPSARRSRRRSSASRTSCGRRARRASPTIPRQWRMRWWRRKSVRCYAQFSSVAPEVESLAAARRYAEALERIATLRPAVDAFFDKVMVMAPDAALRRNRLSLIAEVAGRFSSIADFSEIVSG